MEEQNTSHFKMATWMFIAIAIIAGAVYLFAGGSSENKDVQVKDLVKTDNEVKDTNMVEITMKTNLGDIKIELFKDKAPKTVENFTKLAKEGFYDGTRFHRIIKDFMIQGGDPLSKDTSVKDRWGTGGPGYSFEDEINDQKIIKGALAMANSGPNTNGSQFFIVTVGEAPWLDGLHTVFGKVVEGMDIVDAIENSETDGRDQPLEDVIIEQITVN